MDLTFECDCGSDVSAYTRGEDEVKLQYRCDDCGTVYAVTITPIEGPFA